MAGYAIGKSMNLGFPGTYARTPDDVIMSRAVKEDSKAIPFGAPVILNSDNTYLWVMLRLQQIILLV